MKNHMRVLSLLTIVNLTGCGTTLKVKKAPETPVSGVVYTLPMTQFDITTKWRVAECDKDTNVIQVASSFEITPKSSDDDSHTYVIDPASMSHFFNSTSTDIKFHEGTRSLKSVNASVQDKTGSAIASTVKLIAGIISPISPAASAQPISLKCYDTRIGDSGMGRDPNRNIKQEVKDAKSQDTTVKKLTKDIEKATLLLAQSEALQASKLPGKDPVVDQQVAAQKTQLKTMGEQLKLEEKKLTNLLKPITAELKTTWPPDGNTFEKNAAITLPKSAFERWIGPTNLFIGSQKDFDIDLKLSAPTKYSAAKLENNPKAPEGIFYRTPVDGVLEISGQKNDENGGLKYTKLKEHKVKISQLGYVNSIKVTSKPFESAEFSAEFSATGHLLSAGYKRTAVPSEAVLSAANSAILDLNALKAREAAKPQAELDAELKRLTTEASIAEAEKKLNPPATSEEQKALEALNAETTLLNAQIARLEAEKKLETPEISDEQNALNSLNAETAYLNARIARLEAEKKLDELGGN